MMSSRSVTHFAIVFFASGLMLNACSHKEADPAVTPDSQQAKGLAEYMSLMQVYTHKILLSVESENSELAGFYVHELEEVTEDVIEHIREYDGFRISDLTRAMLLPVIEDLEDELESGDWEQIRQKARILVGSCNSCHMSTDHGYIVIPEETSGNPFLQEF